MSENEPTIASQRRRIAWIDYAKGIAIICVFAMHSAMPEWFTAYLSAFCMMVFFALSGYVFSLKKYNSFSSFIRSRVRTLIIPGFILSIIPFVIERLLTFQSNPWSGKQYGIFLFGYLVNLRGRSGFGQIPWFLACLFVIEIMAYMLSRWTENKKNVGAAYICVAALFFAIGYGYSVLVHIVLPWSFDVALSMFAFFIMGMFLRKVDLCVLERYLSWGWMFLAFTLLWAGTYVNMAIAGSRIDPYMDTYGNVFCYASASFGGVWLTMIVSYNLEHKLNTNLAFLSFCGRNTLVFYCLNAAIYGSMIPWILTLIGLNTNSGDSAMQFACGLLAILINLIIVCPISMLINRYCPQILGRKAR